MKIFSNINLNWLVLVTAVLFLVFLPLSNSIDFMQNDDWNRYYTVSQFLKGDFRLLDVTATTFYTQGFIGLAFAKLFSVQRLPILTLIFGCLNFFIFSYTCLKFFNIGRTKAILAGLILFFNPLHFYSLFGFMTEVYLMTFCLLAIYFYLHSDSLKAQTAANISWILGFFAKQWAIVFSASYLGTLLLKRKWKLAAIQFAVLILVLAYYFFFFPKTNEMTGQKSFEINNYKSIKYMLTHAYAYFIYLSVFSLPFIWNIIVNNFAEVKTTIRFQLIILAGLLSASAKILFNQTTYPWKNFPLYPNIFTDKGFFLSGMEGEAYTNLYAPLIYLLDEIGLFSLILLVAVLVFRKKINWSFLNFETGAIFVGYLLIVGTPFVFDRYILVLIPSAIMFLLRIAQDSPTVSKKANKINMWILCGYLLLQTFISIDYGIEYINRNQLTWRIANQIHEEEGVPRDQIIASHAWNKYYKLNTDKAVYWFRYSRRLPNPNELVSREFWSYGIFTKINTDVIRIQDR